MAWLKVIVALFAVSTCALVMASEADDRTKEKKLSLTVAKIEDGVSGVAQISENLLFMHSNSSVTLICTGDNDAAWVKRSSENPDVEVKISNNAKLPLVAHSMIDDSGEYTCYRKKQHGGNRSNVTVSVYVSDLTNWAKRIDITKSQFKKDFELRCPSKEGADDTIKWFRNGDPIVTSDTTIVSPDGGLLTIKKPISFDTGVYACEKYDDDGLAERKLFQVSGNATARKMDSLSKNLMEGSEIALHCRVYGYPMPAVQWQRISTETHNKEDLNMDVEGDLKGRLQLSAYKGVTDAQLTITNLRIADSATYVCRAANAFNGDEWSESTVIVRVKDKLAALWPFLAICAEVVILCTIIFLYERRRSKQEAAEEENNEQDVKKGLTSNDGIDVRQRQQVKA